ncbi:hypothetical protein ACQF36_37545 [Streptomyces sp. Marseille-Q5077]
MIQGSGDFNFAGLHAVRRRFPGRHITRDRDVIMVRPPPRQEE